LFSSLSSNVVKFVANFAIKYNEKFSPYTAIKIIRHPYIFYNFYYVEQNKYNKILLTVSFINK